MAGIGGHCLGMSEVVGHFVGMAVVAECWRKEEEVDFGEEEVEVDYLVMVGEFGGVEG